MKLKKLIKKYQDLLDTVQGNQKSKHYGDNYDYDTDIKHLSEFINDLKKLEL